MGLCSEKFGVVNGYYQFSSVKGSLFQEKKFKTICVVIHSFRQNS